MNLYILESCSEPLQKEGYSVQCICCTFARHYERGCNKLHLLIRYYQQLDKLIEFPHVVR